jgi:hypothetical protein
VLGEADIRFNLHSILQNDPNYMRNSSTRSGVDISLMAEARPQTEPELIRRLRLYNRIFRELLQQLWNSYSRAIGIVVLPQFWIVEL